VCVWFFFVVGEGLFFRFFLWLFLFLSFVWVGLVRKLRALGCPVHSGKQAKNPGTFVSFGVGFAVMGG